MIGDFSAVPVAADPIEPPFGLTGEELARIVGSGDRLRWTRSHQLRGLRNEAASAVVTLSWDGSEGPVDRDLFVKCTDHQEAAKLGWLSARGDLVPQLVAVVERPDHVVLLTEFLPRVGVGPTDLPRAISLLVELALLAPPTDLFAPHPGSPAAAMEDQIAAALQQVVVPGPAPHTAWLAAYRELERRVGSHPCWLIHGELAGQQLGSRRPGGPLLLLDVATVAIGPRMTDAAQLLTAFADATERRWEELILSCLQRLTAAGAAAPDLGIALAEAREVRAVTAMWSLPWLISDPRVRPELPTRINRAADDLLRLGLL